MSSRLVSFELTWSPGVRAADKAAGVRQLHVVQALDRPNADAGLQQSA